MSEAFRRFDTAVIGEGAAGFAAAIHAVGRAQSVAVVAKAPGASSVSSGAWNFGDTDAWRRPLVDWASAPDFKTLLASGQEIADALAPWLPIQLSPEAPFSLPTSAGTFRTTYGAQAWQAAADRKRLMGKKVALVSGDNWRWHPKQVAARLSAEGIDCRALSWPWGGTGADWPLARVAARWRDDETLAGKLATFLQANAGEFDFFLLPPLVPTKAFADRLQQAVPDRWAECLATTEPTAGWRLQLAMRQALEERSVTRFEGGEIRAITTGRRLESIAVTSPGGPRILIAKRFILATGRYLGGGLSLLPGGPRGSLLGLPLYRERGKLLKVGDPEIYRREPYWREIGVWVDENFHPLGPDAKPVWDNVQACGSLAGGVDYAAARLGIGYFFHQGKTCALVTE